MTSVKIKENYAFIVSWIRQKTSFALANSLCTYLRSSRSVFTTLQTHTQWIHCLHLQRLTKLHQMLVELYYPFEFHILHTLHATTASNARNMIKLNCNKRSIWRLASWHAVILYFNVNK